MIFGGAPRNSVGCGKALRLAIDLYRPRSSSTARSKILRARRGTNHFVFNAFDVAARPVAVLPLDAAGRLGRVLLLLVVVSLEAQQCCTPKEKAGCQHRIRTRCTWASTRCSTRRGRRQASTPSCRDSAYRILWREQIVPVRKSGLRTPFQTLQIGFQPSPLTD